MSASNKPLITTTGGRPSPQYFNKLLDLYEAIMGEDGATYSIQLGTRVKDYISGSTNVNKTYTSPMRGLTIMNDGNTDLTFTVNGLTITVKAGEGLDEMFDPFTSLIIATSSDFRAIVKG